MIFSQLSKLQGLKLTNFSLFTKKSLVIAIVFTLIVAAGWASYHIGGKLYPAIADAKTMDVWFHTDAPRVFVDMTEYGAPHDRTSVHPLFVILVLPLVNVVKTVLFLTPMMSVRIVLAVVASLWIGLLFVTLRLIGCHLLDAILFSILGAVSAATMFWLAVPDVYPFGGLTILLGLSFIALTEHRQLSPLWYIVTSALTLSITVTNWMVGILATIVSYPWKKALQITLKAWGLVVILVLLQKLIFPTTNIGFLKLHETVQGEQQYMNFNNFVSSFNDIQSFVFHTIVMPGVKIFEDPSLKLVRLSAQVSLPGSGSLWGKAAIVFWIALLSLGLWGLFSIKKHLRLRIALGLTLLGQLALHHVYGTDETFLYSLHFAPLLLVLAALSTLTKARLLALILVGMLVISASVNNILQFNQVINFFHTYGYKTDYRTTI